MTKLSDTIIYRSPLRRELGIKFRYEIICQIWQDKECNAYHTILLCDSCEYSRHVIGEGDPSDFIDKIPSKYHASARKSASDWMALHS